MTRVFTRTVTKLFKNIDIRMAFRTTNTIRNYLKPREKTIDAYNQSGIYQLKCNKCPLKYLKQTGCTFKIRYEEHIQAIESKQNSKYAQHILDTEHTNAQSTKH